jgi:hypothetical protein
MLLAGGWGCGRQLVTLIPALTKLARSNAASALVLGSVVGLLITPYLSHWSLLSLLLFTAFFPISAGNTVFGILTLSGSKVLGDESYNILHSARDCLAYAVPEHAGSRERRARLALVTVARGHRCCAGNFDLLVARNRVAICAIREAGNKKRPAGGTSGASFLGTKRSRGMQGMSNAFKSVRVLLDLASLKFWLTVLLFERHTQAVLFPPYDAAMPVQLIGLHDQREFVGNSSCIWNVKGGASLRQVSDRTTVCATIEFNRRAFEDPTSNSPAILIHPRWPFFRSPWEQPLGVLVSGSQLTICNSFRLTRHRPRDRQSWLPKPPKDNATGASHARTSA